MQLSLTSQEIEAKAVISRAQRNLATGISVNQGVKKTVVNFNFMVSVPQTDTGGWGENPKASGTMFVKELGKKAGVP